MEILHFKYGTGLVVHDLSTDCRTIDLAVNGGAHSQRFLNSATAQLCGEVENEFSGGTGLGCLELHRGSKGVWQVTKPLLFFPWNGFRGLPREMVGVWNQEQEAANTAPSFLSTVSAQWHRGPSWDGPWFSPQDFEFLNYRLSSREVLYGR